MLGCPQTSGHAVYFQLKTTDPLSSVHLFLPFLFFWVIKPLCLPAHLFMLKLLFQFSSPLSNISHPSPRPTSLHPSLIIIALLPRRSRGTITADHIAQQHGRPSQQAPSLHGCKRRSHKNRSEPSKCHESAVNSTVDILKASTYERVCLLCPTVCDGRFADCVPSALWWSQHLTKRFCRVMQARLCHAVKWGSWNQMHFLTKRLTEQHMRKCVTRFLTGQDEMPALHQMSSWIM